MIPVKNLFILLSFFLLSSAFAGKAVLISSVKLHKVNYLYLDSKFKKAFAKSGLEVVIHHEATPETLHEVMSDEETEIVLWVSHAGGEQNGEAGFAAKGIIVDFYGNDVKNFFTTTTKNLKFLGIVGCSAKSIIEGFKARGNYNDRPDLEIKSFSEKVKLYPAFKETLKDSLQHVDKSLTLSPDTTEQINIDVSFDKTETNSWLEIGDRVLGLIKNNSDNRPVFTFPLHQWENLKNKNLKLIRSLSKERSTAELPRLEISSSFGNWNIFATKNGTPIGGNDKHLYVFKP